MQHSDPSPDRSSALAFVAFAAAATVWIGVMTAQPKPDGPEASTLVISKDITIVHAQPQPQPIELANLIR